MLTITSYCDESIRSETGVLVLAGYMATSRQWTVFQELWSDALRKDTLSEFKASDCEQGRGEFAGWCEGCRCRSCQRFVSQIAAARLVGVGTIINLHAYEPIRSQMDILRTIPRRQGGVAKFGDPYYLGFQQHCEQVAALAGSAPKEEKVSYVFDRTNEYQAKCLNIFEEVKHKPGSAIGYRMGVISFDESRDYAGLQAADLFAFELRRYAEGVAFADRPEQERWQWQRLTAGQKLRVHQFTENGAEPLLETTRAARDRWEREVDQQ